MYVDHFVPQLKHCWLRSVNKHTLKAGQGTPSMGHWIYTLPSKAANGPFKRGLQHRFGLALSTPKQLEQLPHLNRPCRYPGTVSLQDGKPGLYILQTYTSLSPMARTIGSTSELAWPNLTAACPRNWHVWNRKNAENMGLDRPTPVFFLMGLSR